MNDTFVPKLRRVLRRTDGPRAKPWPGEARCAVAITVDMDGDGNEAGIGEAPLGIHSMGRYAARRGVPRFLDMFQRHGIPGTFFIPGYDCKQSPDLIRRIAEEGHEVGSHGYMHEGFMMTPEEEERRLRLTHDLITDAIGKEPRGWRSPYGQKTRHTMRVLQSMGYVYDSSDKDTDTPYLFGIDGSQERMVEIPNNTPILSDTSWYQDARTAPSDVAREWCDEFDSVYADHGFFILTFHPRPGFGSGLPARANVIDTLIQHIKTHSDVAFVTLEQVADHVHANAADHEELAI